MFASLEGRSDDIPHKGNGAARADVTGTESHHSTIELAPMDAVATRPDPGVSEVES